MEKTDGGKEIYFWFLKRVIDSESVTTNADTYGWRFSFSSAFQTEISPMDVQPGTFFGDSSECFLKAKSLGMYLFQDISHYVVLSHLANRTRQSNLFYFRIRYL